LAVPPPPAEDTAPRAPAEAPPFPDCWTAYGAETPELAAFGSERRLAVGAAWALLAGQALFLLVLAAVVASAAPLPLRVVAAAAVFAVLGAVVVGLLRLIGTARHLWAERAGVRLSRALGPTEMVAWEQIGEIGLAHTPARWAVGLRLRPAAPSRLPAGPRWLQQRVSSDFDFLLFPADGECELLGRVLLRYCIDRKARRRLPAG
jgi:hypothetical protein